MLRLICLQSCLLPSLLFANALPWQQLEPVGSAQLNYFLWPVYSATLFGPSEEFVFPVTRPFALSLEYRRAFSRQDLLEETRRQWQSLDTINTEAWLEQLNGIFRDVEAGDEITLYVDVRGTSEFYFNDQLLGEITDPDFSNRFAAIWLSEKTTHPAFRNKLLSGKTRNKP